VKAVVIALKIQPRKKPSLGAWYNMVMNIQTNLLTSSAIAPYQCLTEAGQAPRQGSWINKLSRDKKLSQDSLNSKRIKDQVLFEF